MPRFLLGSECRFALIAAMGYEPKMPNSASIAAWTGTIPAIRFVVEDMPETV